MDQCTLEEGLSNGDPCSPLAKHLKEACFPFCVFWFGQQVKLCCCLHANNTLIGCEADLMVLFITVCPHSPAPTSTLPGLSLIDKFLCQPLSLVFEFLAVE